MAIEVGAFEPKTPCGTALPRPAREAEAARSLDGSQRRSSGPYFAAPYAAWQRRTNENTNGLFRQYFPKATDFRRLADQTLQAAVNRLNYRPRKCLGYQTPAEVFNQAVRGALAM